MKCFARRMFGEQYGIAVLTVVVTTLGFSGCIFDSPPRNADTGLQQSDTEIDPDSTSMDTADGSSCQETNGGEEICDDVDNDCDGEVDEEAQDAQEFYEDNDGDGFGNPDISERGCEAPTGYVDNDQDCDDSDSAINPDASEVCDGTDNNCDGTRDPADCECEDGNTQACGKSTGVCEQGTQTCTDNSWGACEGSVETSPETCDGQDNDCDGDTDEGVTRDCSLQKGVCQGATTTCTNGSFATCDSSQYGPNYQKKEMSVDGTDNDCDGIVDNVVATEQFGGSDKNVGDGVALNPSNGDIYMAYNSGAEAWLRKYDGDFNHVWDQRTGWPAGAPQDALARGVAFHSSGIYVAGMAPGTVPETDLEKTSTSGDQLWDKDLASDSRSILHHVAVNPNNGAVYATGTSEGDMGTQSNQQNSGGKDILLGKWDAQGNLEWVRVIGGSNKDVGEAVSVDPSTGDVYVAGGTDSNLNGNSNPGKISAFLMRYSSAGTEQWTKILGPSSETSGARGVAFDSQRDAVYLSGDANAGFAGQSGHGGFDGLVGRFQKDGTRDWVRLFGTPESEFRFSADLKEASGAVYLAGLSRGDFGGDTNSGGMDIAVTKFDKNGNQKWAQLVGSSADEAAIGIEIDPRSRDYYVTGWTEGSIGANTNQGGKDVVLLRRKD